MYDLQGLERELENQIIHINKIIFALRGLRLNIILGVWLSLNLLT